MTIVVNGVTYLEFSRPLSAGEPGIDRSINPAIPQYILYAGHETIKPSNPDTFAKHTIRGSQAIVFNTPCMVEVTFL